MNKNITFIQLKAARHIMNLGTRDIGELLNVSKGTVSKAELGKTRDFFYKNSPSLKNFFERNDIVFPTEYSIRLSNKNLITLNNSTLTKFQLKTARVILSMSQRDVAREVGVSPGLIKRLEKLSNIEYIHPRNKEVAVSLKSYFEDRNIEFPDPLYVFFKKYVDKASIR